jgi:hypothetical protein
VFLNEINAKVHWKCQIELDLTIPNDDDILIGTLSLVLISSAHVNTATFTAVVCLIMPVYGGGLI